MLVPGGEEFLRVLDRSWLLVVEPGCYMDFSSMRGPVRDEFAKRVQVGSHEYCHILGRNGAIVLVDDGEGNIIVLVVALISVRNGRFTMLDPYCSGKTPRYDKPSLKVG